MSILAIIGIVVGAALLILLLAALFASNQYSIQREIVINRPLPVVFDYIRLLKNHDYYNKWVMMDPHSKKTYRGTDGEAGFVYAWDSENKNAGKGEQEITRVAEGKRIDYDIRFEKPFKNTATAFMSAEAAGSGQTKVTWGFAGTRNFLMRIFHILFNLKKMLGNDLYTSLSNLKTLLEKS